ncbi:hypothetical protein MNR01_02665 [Lysobacter sp. S4-A87]|uniref:hypothetical protein n=1 Tax=Lysobacter sp. S4-A87 TaxID=2925843 RepID=UPI001F5357F9|nr:hypothetical protein [Lysobacter sp. S4-A87]UNK49960.1 hypothetical protein MNR01_02665 [Lysobacter sp. S4-A87]
MAVEPGAPSPMPVKAVPMPPAELASRAAMARSNDRPTLEKAVAGVVVGALAAQFDGRAVEARFGAISDEPGESGQRSVSGEGQMRFTGDVAWIGFQFRTRYDVLLGQAGPPELVLGVGGDARPVPNDTAMVQRLDDHLVDTLRRTLGSTSVRLQLDRIESVETGQDYLLIDAWGLADFGIDGSSNIRIAAFYDRRSGQWLQLHYDMATPPAAALPPVAGR